MTQSKLDMRNFFSHTRMFLGMRHAEQGERGTFLAEEHEISAQKEKFDLVH